MTSWTSQPCACGGNHLCGICLGSGIRQVKEELPDTVDEAVVEVVSDLTADERTVAAFRDLYWNKRAPWTKTTWRGHQVAKCPLDLWVYQEIIHETKPGLIIELGSSIGGSSLFFAEMGNCEVWAVDELHYASRPKHPQILYLTGSSVDQQIRSDIRRAALSYDGVRTMLVLDSLHTYEHVAAELEAYADLVTPGCYLVVEDTAVDEAWGKPAALAATNEFLQSHPGFVMDRSREKHLMTLNPGGWIRREF